MITATFERHGVLIAGHAETAELGHDLVCAAVSGIVGTYVNGLLLYNDEFTVQESEAGTSVTFKYLDELIIRFTAATIIGLKQIEKQHPEAIEVSLSNEYRRHIERYDLNE